MIRAFFPLAAVVSFTILLGPPAIAGDQVRGDAVAYRSASGVEERCVPIAPIPGGSYSQEDRDEEERLCSIDFYAESIALCPKLWSTSPATIVYDLSSSAYAGKQTEFESQVCSKGGSARQESSGELAMYKMSMNEADTSGTSSTSSLLYYHLSRYFDTVIGVPVSVYRSMDKDAHNARVTSRGLKWSTGKSSLKMLHAGYTALNAAQTNPDGYAHASEVVTTDRKKVYGILLVSEGRRYTSVINGTREHGWGVGQVEDFQQTAPFLALRIAQTLEEAIESGISEARHNPHLDHDMGSSLAREQMVFWMRELTELSLLDYILGQQDRIGNVDYIDHWYWVENGKVRRERANGDTPPAAAGGKAKLLKRSRINDNDAGVRTSYIDFARKTHMLDGMRHYSADTYKKLQDLQKDFSQNGPLFEHIKSSYGLTSAELERIVRNTAEAAEVLAESCSKGELSFDLEPEEYLVSGKVEPKKVSCSAD